jgi:hypothetical protein
MTFLERSLSLLVGWLVGGLVLFTDDHGQDIKYLYDAQVQAQILSFFFFSFFSCASLDLSYFLPLFIIFLSVNFATVVDCLSQYFLTSVHSFLLFSSLGF